MRKPSTIETLYIDFDSFFASAEQHFNPELRNRPVAVIPLHSENTSCIAASREARPFGVKTGTSLPEARRLCPGIRFVVARHDVYVRLHERIVALVNRFVPVAATRSIDELMCNLLPSEAARVMSIAHAIKRALRQNLSAALTCSIGFAPNELLAKIAAEIDKPDAIVMIRPQDLPGRLLELNLRDLPGISRGIEQRLLRAGVRDVAALWALSAKHARAIWHSVEGERFWAALHGFTVPRIETQRRMFGHSRILPTAWRTPDKAHMCAKMLVMSAARRLRRAGFLARSMSISLKSRSKPRQSIETAFPPARDDHTLIRILATQFESLHSDRRLVYPVNSVSVMLHNLVQDRQITTDMFSNTHSADQNQKRWEQLSELSDHLRARFGASALTLGPYDPIPGGYLGAKIAFDRVPDLQDFWESAEQSKSAIILS